MSRWSLSLWSLSLMIGCGLPAVYTEDVTRNENPVPVIVPVVPVVFEEPVLVDESTSCPSPLVEETRLLRLLTAAADPGNRPRFMLWRDDYGDDVLGPHEGDVEVVYISKGIRYTLWYLPQGADSDDPEGLVSVWERPNGTTSPRDIDTYSDNRVTGCVNFGVGDESRYGSGGRLMRWNERSTPEVGREHHHGWQGRYAQAIDGLASTLKIP